MSAQPTLMLVGNPDVTHIGSHFRSAAHAAGLQVAFCDTRAAFAGPAPLRTLNWRLRGHRPVRLRQFSDEVVMRCRAIRPTWLLTTGLAPLDARALSAIGELGIPRLNYLTDDPWNPAHRAAWFLEALPAYDRVCSPRRSNLADLRQLGCPQIEYLPFAYAPEVHFPEAPPDTEAGRFAADVVFLGGADRDRVPIMTALIRAGIRPALWGGYWDRHAETRAYARGHADPRVVRQAIAGAKLALCLVRRANRDGHAMRSYEVPAMGACMLADDTGEHREIFGEDGQAVVYFRTIGEMVERANWLTANAAQRERLARSAHSLIVNGQNTYRDRLLTILRRDESGGLVS